MEKAELLSNQRVEKKRKNSVKVVAGVLGGLAFLTGITGINKMYNLPDEPKRISSMNELVDVYEPHGVLDEREQELVYRVTGIDANSKPISSLTNEEWNYFFSVVNY